MSQKEKRNGIMGMDEKELPYAQWLYQIKGMGSKTIVKLLGDNRKPSEVYAMTCGEWEELLPQGKHAIVKVMEENRLHYNPEEEYGKLLDKGIHFTCLGQLTYPDMLAHISDKPFGIYYKGKLPDEDKPSIAIIGARNCSAYGKYMAEKLGHELAEAGVQVISGMARGVDGISQYAALEKGGYSMAVFGCGVDICYPAENGNLYRMLVEKGGICSEYVPGTAPQANLFPPRNRIISGMSDGVLVIEARNKSGTLITVDMALEQGKEVFALPGRVTEPLSEGCNRLIKQGACVVQDTQDILQELEKLHRYNKETTEFLRKKTREKCTKECKCKGTIEVETENERTRKILQDIIDYSPKSIEQIRIELFHRIGNLYSIPEMLGVLMEMEVLGLIHRAGNGCFVR
ncbi:MAG: DNA-processing protein DprA [Lachnospiraceae bacterium]|nr:DNA-processing protein DprA [Lachnospiraceae bacterium]